jgi:hypothetical protein
VGARVSGRVLAGTFAAGLALLLATGGARPRLDSAPADSYFGLLRISYLEIENRFKDTALRAGDHTVDPKVYSSADFAADALGDWARAYPRDPQLPRALFLGSRAFAKIWIREYQDRAWSYMQRIVTRYPTSYFGKQVRRNLAIGFTEHYFAEAVPCEPLAAPNAPLEASTPAATVTPSAQPQAGRPKIQIEPVPCLTPTPTPTPSPEPSPTTPAPNPTVTPSSTPPPKPAT